MTREGKEKAFCKRGNALHTCVPVLKLGLFLMFQSFRKSKFTCKVNAQ